MPAQKLLLSIKEAAAALGICERSVTYLLTDGRLPRRRIGRRTLIPWDAIEAFARTDMPECIAPSQPAEGGR